MQDRPYMSLSWGRNRYDFSWETLRSFLDGVSPIDLNRLALQSRDEAYQFLVHYGYDMAIPSEHHEAWTVFREGIEYLERVLCPAPTPEDQAVGLPEDLQQITDLTEILLLASHGGPLQPWACALLRVMHTISHANHAVRSPFYQEIQSQILERYRQHVHQDAQGKLHLGTGLLAVPLEDIQLREEKSRDSLILKLLHKPDNVAQGVYDRIGVKLVTPTKVDALLVLKYIRRNHLAIFANIMPGRSRNTLIDLERFRDVYESISRPGAPGSFKSNWAALQRPTESSGEENPPQNPHSSSTFRSIQFTCRQLIRVPNPQYSALQELRAALSERIPNEELAALLSKLSADNPEPVLRFFFPYEVQILDHENHLRTLEGESSHANYRLRQLRTARRRVLGSLLTE
ncbi:MAG: TIGR04552 family protein [Candidatus Eremiobacteraeota bacterium]|nr:TIGR04552 family protein [Candidatus Eremiobacteraeota bacterium]